MRIASIVFSVVAATATVALLTAAASADDITLPTRKSGLWEIKIIPDTPGSAPAMAMQICLDPATDKAMMEAGLSMTADMCPELTQTRDGDAIVLDATCNVAGLRTKSHTVISGDFQSAYTIKTVSDSEGGSPALPKNSVMTQEAKWLGECATTLQPGEMMMFGRKINVLDTMKKIGG